ncbi:MAG: hypothetical protein GY778_17865 [bacterium]|nr:hypothetical protein [bacterium]
MPPTGFLDGDSSGKKGLGGPVIQVVVETQAQATQTLTSQGGGTGD